MLNLTNIMKRASVSPSKPYPKNSRLEKFDGRSLIKSVSMVVNGETMYCLDSNWNAVIEHINGLEGDCPWCKQRDNYSSGGDFQWHYGTIHKRVEGTPSRGGRWEGYRGVNGQCVAACDDDRLARWEYFQVDKNDTIGVNRDYSSK